MGSNEPVVLGHISRPEWVMAATLFAWQERYTTLLTTTQRRHRLAVGIEMLPGRTASDFTPGMREEWSRRWIARLDEFHEHPETAVNALPPHLNVEPLLDALDRHDRRPRVNTSKWLTWESDQMADLATSVRDAVIYAHAVAAGESAAKALSAAHDISIRTAEGRIRRARQRGLLTHHDNPRTPSMLTEKAANIIERLTGERPYPYVTEDGEVVLGPT